MVCRMPASLVDRFPEVEPAELIAGLVPPPRFDAYVPNPDEPTQAASVEAARASAGQIERGASPRKSRLRSLFGGSGLPEGSRGRYFGGGVGVGKTHLLASLWHAVAGPKAYG